MPKGKQSSVPNESLISQLLNQLADAVVQRNLKLVEQVTKKLLKKETDVFQIINQGLTPGILKASNKFRNGEFFIPEIMMASLAVRAGLQALRPLIRERSEQIAGRIVIGTVKFDLHDIGKNLVITVLEGNGFEVIDLGVDVSPERFVRAAEKQHAQILAMSSLLTSTMPWMKTTIQLLHSSGLRKVKTLVGGAPVTQLYADRIGADAYCREAASVAGTVRNLMEIQDLSKSNAD